MKTLLTLIATFFISITLGLCASPEEKGMYVLLLNVNDDAYQQEIRAHFTEFAKSIGFEVHEKGLQLGKIENFPQETIFFSRLDFIRNEDFKNTSKSISGVIRGDLCRGDIGQRTYFFVMNRESVKAYNLKSYSNRSLEELELLLSRRLGEIIDKNNDQKPLLFVQNN